MASADGSSVEQFVIWLFVASADGSSIDQFGIWIFVASADGSSIDQFGISTPLGSPVLGKAEVISVVQAA